MSGETLRIGAEVGAYVEVWGQSGWDEWGWYQLEEDAVSEAKRISRHCLARVVKVDYGTMEAVEFEDGSEVGCAL